MLTQRRLVYSEVPNQDDADNEDDADTLLDHSISRLSSVASSSSGITGTGDQAELHFSEAWFHGNLERGRETAEQMLYENAHMGDGTFIVRKSQVCIMELGWTGGITSTTLIYTKNSPLRPLKMSLAFLDFNSIFQTFLVHINNTRP